MPLVTTTHSILRAQADEALALTERVPDVALDVAEHPENPDLYLLSWFVNQKNKNILNNNLIESFKLKDELEWAAVDENVDYVAETRKAFPPLIIGPFFIARNDEPTPPDHLGLSIAPNRAFGSGEHATTTGCLTSYLKQAENRMFMNGLDVGTGSAILALAAARYQKTPFVATDNDAPSVAIANGNAAANGLAKFFHAVEDEALTHPAVITHAPYDLIFANILMEPLITLAPAIARLLEEKGILILSGFTDEQRESVHQAYRAQGCTLVESTGTVTPAAQWCTSTFTK